ncbi:MAG: AmmeMemoRadiSam system radical SAM enzyme [Candidatus Saccharibacteria bacterium]
MKPEVPYYEKMSDNQVQCHVCPQNCCIKPDGRGVCRVRKNVGGELLALNFGEVSAIALDPIEKKPLYHFYPGRAILSLGTVGCNLSCGFCQNYHIAQEEPSTRYVSPEELAELAVETRERDSIGVAYTYSEPLMWYEYLVAATPIVKDHDLQNVLVTNGFINQEPMEKLLPYIDAMNIDLKSFTESFYHKNCKGKLEPVKQTIGTCAGHTHIEITTLVIPGENDRPDEIEELANWIAGISPEIPLHLSRYHPAYKFYQPPTPAETMEQARQAAKAHLKYVYVGNMAGFDNNTYCPNCGEIMVERSGFHVSLSSNYGTQCAKCGQKQSIVE